MKKRHIALSSIFIIALGVGFFTFNRNSGAEPVSAAVGSYSRSQATYYTSDFSHKVTSFSYGTTLLSTLHELMYDSHKSYNTYDELGTYTKEVDIDIDNPGNIILLYSRQSLDGTATWSSWNREHVWCQSHAFYTTGTGAGSDLHHLRAASTAYNSARSNKPYGIVTTHDSSTRMGSTDCYSTGSLFEPADYIKGDIARILMYMYMHYSSSVGGSSSYSGTLNITDIVTTSANTDQAAWDLLMDWNESDPVDYQEMYRNNKCAYYLGNFNPFIDHPEFARMIWDDTATYQAGLFFQNSYKTVNVGSSYTNTASAWGRVTTSGSVTYTSDNPDIASVNATTGQVTGVSNGVARIKARATINGVSKISYHFVVVGSGHTPKNTLTSSGVVYTPTSASTAKKSETLGSETLSYSNTYTTANFHTQITSGKTATMTITNFPKTIKSIILSMHSNKSGGSGTISVTVGGSSYYSFTGAFNTLYGSYSQSYVPIDVTNGSASKKTGTIVITISSTAGSLYFEKAIVDYTERIVTKATAISVSPSSLTLTAGEDAVFSASFTPSTTTLKTYTFTSSNNSVATINAYGRLKTIANGNATITATASDGSGVTGTASITVSNSVVPAGDPTVTGVTVSPSSTSLDVYSNPSTTLSATVNGTNNPSQAVTWSVYSSSPSGCATVNSSGTVTAVNAGTAVIRATSDADSTYYGSCTVTITDSTPVVSSITASVSKTYYVGDVITSSDITVKDNLDNTIAVFTFANNNYQFTYSDASSGGSLTNKTFVNAITGAGKTCSLTVQVQRKARSSTGTTDDALNKASTGNPSSYTSWSGVNGASGAVYAGHSSGTNNSIQLRSTQTDSTYYSGVVMTSASAGTISKVTVVWEGHTIDGRTLNVYGKNSAYTSPNDLFSSSTAGTLLGTIVYGTSTELNITGSYSYVGVRSSSGAMYLTSITFKHTNPDTAANLANYIMYEDTNNQCTSKFTTAKGYFEGLTTAERSTFMNSNDYVISTARTRFEAWARHLGKTITVSNGDYVINVNNTAIKVINNANEKVLPIIIITSIIILTSIGGYIYFKKNRKIEKE